MKEDIDQYMNSGFNDLIKKPIEIENFFKTIKKYLE
jgi:CheY-like chemotaxis protein